MQQQWRGIVFTFRYIPLLLYRAYIDLHEDESQKHDGRKKSSEQSDKRCVLTCRHLLNIKTH